jgi:hypothetical protein
MADGIRLRLSQETLSTLNLSETLTNKPWVIRDISRPLTSPIDCWMCGTHEYKTYHFMLDSQGTVLVSETIWEKLKQLYDNGGFELAGHTSAPPAQSLMVPTAKVNLTIQDL